MPESDEVPGLAPPVLSDGAAAANRSPQSVNVADAASEHIIDLVGKIKAATTLKVVTLLRIVVYGLVVAIAVITALVLAVLGLVRLWDAYLPLDPVGRRGLAGLRGAGSTSLPRRGRLARTTPDGAEMTFEETLRRAWPEATSLLEYPGTDQS